MQEVNIQHIVQALAKRECVLFLGAGACRDAGLPDWLGLAKNLRDELKLEGKLPDQYADLIDHLLHDKSNVQLAMDLVVNIVPRKDIAQALRKILEPC